jgi:hypothetical protein
LDSDRRPVDHDTINQVANVSLRSSAVRRQLAEGLRHESFDIGGRNAQDRSRFALVALQSRLRGSPLAAATRVWRDLFPTPTQVYREGYKIIRSGWDAA